MKIVDKNTGEQYPVISASDVFLPGTEAESDENLQTHIKKQDDSISKLKSNVKWLYKYGGVGSGGSGTGGSGTSKDWAIYAALADDGTENFEKITDGEQKIFDGTKSTRKTLQIRINYHNNSLYRVKVTNEGTPLFSGWQTLSSENMYTLQVSVSVNGNSSNGGLQITVEDSQTFVTKQLRMTYISSPYQISLSLLALDKVTGTETPITGNEYLLSLYQGKVPVFRLSYEILLPFTQFWITPSGGFLDSPESVQIPNSDYAKGRWDVEFPEELLSAGTYELQEDIQFIIGQTSADPVRLTLKKEITVIPSSLFLKISTDNLSQFFISEDSDPGPETIPEKCSRAQGLSKFTVMVYDGVKINPSPNYRVTVQTAYKKYTETETEDGETLRTYDPEWTVASAGLPVNMNMQVSTLLNAVDYNQSGLWRTTFEAESGKDGSVYRIHYYTVARPLSANLSWFDEGESSPVVLEYSSYFRKDNNGMELKNLSIPESPLYQGSPFSEGSSFGESQSNTATSYIETSRIQAKNRFICFYPDQTGSPRNPVDSAFTGQDRRSVLLSLSLQFSKINPTDILSGIIAKLYTAPFENSSSIQPYYLTKYRLYNPSDSGSNQDKICIPSESFAPSDNLRYHLVQILFQYLGETAGSSPQPQYAMYMYIDGQLESNGDNIVTAPTPLYGVELMNQQCSYNLIDLEIFKERTVADRSFSFDSIVYRYWQMYRMLYITGEPLDTNSLDYMLIGDNPWAENIKFDGTTVQVGEIYPYNSETGVKNQNYELLNNIAARIDIPIVLLSVSRSKNSDGYFQKSLWDRLVQANSTNLLFNGTIVDVYFSPGRDLLQLQTIPGTLGDKLGVSGVQFQIDAQGTSTLEDRIKNIQLTASGSGNQIDLGKKLAFSPNYLANDSGTFLPEKSWTLKADVVDSAHSNNTSIGKFVNKMCIDHYPVGESVFCDKHQKVCLQGMPCLLFFSDLWYEKDENNVNVLKTRIVYGGYYNFNIGRESYNNLAYNNKETIQEIVRCLQQNDYGENAPYFKWAVYDEQICEGLGVAEITDNIGYFDFSQWADMDNLLFQSSINTDSGYMYSKLVSSRETELKQALQNLNKSVSTAGYYIFKQLGKNFTDTAGQNTYDESGNIITDLEGIPVLTTESTYDITDAYRIPNLVTNPKIQYCNAVKPGSSEVTKQPIDYTDTYWINKNITGELINSMYDNANIDNLVSLVCTARISDDMSDASITPALNYKYTVIYYVILLAFGLVDSILKNLNMKTWNIQKTASGGVLATFYPMFYDMDTALELNNGGGEKISFLAALDYWSNNVDSSTGYLTDVTVKRDYWPLNSTTPGFDFPSSYLFGIAKYAYTVLKTEEGTNSLAEAAIDSLENINPQLVWARLRMKDEPTVSESGESSKWGLLESVDYFIDNFFTQGFSQANEFFISLNYKLKYLFYNTGNASGFQFTPSKFHGTRKQRVKEWLERRIYFMDTIFNITKSNLIISQSSSANYLENQFANIPDTLQNCLQTNDNIPILHDAFSNQSDTSQNTPQRLGDSGTIEIWAPDKTPLFIRNSSVYKLYFLNGAEQGRNLVSVTNAGTAVIIPFGSTLWTDVSQIDVFALSPLYVNSENLEAVRCYTQKSIASYDITGSKIELIELAAPMYTKDVKDDIPLRSFGGTLSFTGDRASEMSALTTINIPRTQMNLELSGLPSLTDINIAGTQAQSVKISQCPYLRNIVFEDVRYGQNRNNHRTAISDEINVSGYCGSVYMTTVDCKYINIICTEPDQTCWISGNQTLETLELEGFKTVVVQNCPLLKNVTVKDNPVLGLYCEYLAVHQYTGKYSDALKDPGTFVIQTGGSNTVPGADYQCDLSGLSRLRSFSLPGFAGNCTDDLTLYLPESDIVIAQEATSGYSINRTYYNQTLDSKTKEYTYTLVTAAETVSIPASQALNGCSAFKYINTPKRDGEYTGKLWIAAPGVFKGCSRYDGYGALHVWTNMTVGYPDDMSGCVMESVAGLFEGCSAIQLSIAQYLVSLIKNPEDVRNMSRMFAECSGIAYTSGTTYHFDFSRFTNVVNVSEMFSKCPKVTALTKSLLNFEAPESSGPDDPDSDWYIDMSGFVSASDITVFPDTFEVVGKRLRSFYSGQGGSQSVKFTIHNSGGSVTLSDFMSQFPNITLLTSLEISGLASLDVRYAFAGNPRLLTLDRSFNSLDNSAVTGINDLLKISETVYHGSLQLISNSFNSSTGTPAETIDLAGFYDWEDKLGSDTVLGLNLFGTSSQAPSNFGAWKRSLEGDSGYIFWWNLHQKYQNKFSSMSSLFYNTYVEMPSGDSGRVFDGLPEQVIRYGVSPEDPDGTFKFSERIKDVSNMFRNFEVRVTDSERTYIRPVRFWTEDWSKTVFDMLPYATSAENAFSSVLFWEMLPPDFFRKRRKVNYGNVYRTGSLTYDLTDNKTECRAYGYVYDRTMTNLNRCFSGSKFLTGNSAFTYFDESDPEKYSAICGIYPDNRVTESWDSEVPADVLPEYVFGIQESTVETGHLLTFEYGGNTYERLTTHWSAGVPKLSAYGDITVSTVNGLSQVKTGGTNLGVFNVPVATISSGELAEISDVIENNDWFTVEIDSDGYLLYSGKRICSTGIDFYDTSRSPYILPGEYTARKSDDSAVPDKIVLYANLPEGTSGTLTVSVRQMPGTVVKLGRSLLHRNGRKISQYAENITQDGSQVFIHNPGVSSSNLSYRPGSAVNPTVNGMYVQPGLDTVKNQAWNPNTDTDIVLDLRNQSSSPIPDDFSAKVPGYTFPFCPPDLLKGLIPDTSGSPQFKDIISGWNVSGYIPEGLVSDFTSASSLSGANLFSSVTVLPVLRDAVYNKKRIWWWDSDWNYHKQDCQTATMAYVFVPDGFTGMYQASGLLDFTVPLPPKFEKRGEDNSEVLQDVFFVFDTDALDWDNLMSTAGMLPEISRDAFTVQDWKTYMNLHCPLLQDLTVRQQVARLVKNEKWPGSGDNTDNQTEIGYSSSLRLVKPSEYVANPEYSGLPVYYSGKSTVLSGTLSPAWAGILEGRVFARQSFSGITSRNITKLDSTVSDPVPVISASSDWGWIGTRIILPTGYVTSSAKPVLISKGAPDSSSVLDPIPVSYLRITDDNVSSDSQAYTYYSETMGYQNA